MKRNLEKARQVFFVFFLCICFVMIGCKDDPSDSNAVTVSFNPYIEKRLDKIGPIDYRIEDLHWKYYCSSTKCAAYADESDWLDFPGVDKGLGVINGLTRGSSYYFGLRAFLSNSDYSEADMLFEGYREEIFTLNSKKSLVVIEIRFKSD